MIKRIFFSFIAFTFFPFAILPFTCQSSASADLQSLRHDELRP